MIIDDEMGIIDAVSSMLARNGYKSIGFVNPLDGLEELKNNHYDMLVLDYFMLPVRGDTVVEMIRKEIENISLYILLLTGHKDLAPPISTIKSLEIQAYCEKSDRLDQLQLLIESGIKSISQMRTIKKFQDGLNSILGAVPQIYQLQPIGNILEQILIQILPLVDSSDAFILVDYLPENNKQNANRSIFKGMGKYKADIDHFIELLEPELLEELGLARHENRIIKTKNGIVFPLDSGTNTSLGVLYVESDNADEGLKLLEIYANQAASSINNAFLHSLVNTKNEELNSTYSLLKSRYLDTIEVLRLTVDAKDEYTRGHSDRVAQYASIIGKALGISEQDNEILRLAGVFHDIGKIGTADDILLKTEKLSVDEYEEIKKHPGKSAMILSAVSMFNEVVPIVLHHHERFDGKGYPDKLKGEEIDLLARIISVVDAFDAMTSDRQYRSHMSVDQAIEQLVTGSGSQFDSNIVEVFVRLVREDPEIKKINNMWRDDEIKV